MSVESLREGRRYQVELQDGVEEFDFRQLRDLIRSGVVGATTFVSAAGGEEWKMAADHEDLRRYIELAGAARESAALAPPSVSAKRLIIYLALGGLVAGAIMSILAPICLFIGVFAKFVVSFAAFGAVLALGINSAVREDDTRLIGITAASFAAGGLVAWLIRGTAQFTAMHFAIIGLIGAAGLCWGLGFGLRRAIPVVAAALVFFPLAVAMLGRFLPEGQISPILALLVLPLSIFLPSIPFAFFGGILGAVMAMTEETT